MFFSIKLWFAPILGGSVALHVICSASSACRPRVAVIFIFLACPALPGGFFPGESWIARLLFLPAGPCVNDLKCSLSVSKNKSANAFCVPNRCWEY